VFGLTSLCIWNVRKYHEMPEKYNISLIEVCSGGNCRSKFVITNWIVECYSSFDHVSRNIGKMFILVINQLDAKNLFYIKFISCLYMFRALCAHRQEVKILLYSSWYHHTCRWSSGAQVERGLCTGRPLTGVIIPDAV
jgi:hypothetical protein